MAISPLFLVLIILPFCLLRWIFSSSSRGPPGPAPLPLIGHLHLLAKGSAPNILFTELARKYGPLTSLRIGTVPVVVASTREAVKEIIKHHDAVFASRPPGAVGRILHENYNDMGLAPYGERWRQLRRICSTELFHPRTVASFNRVRMFEVRSLLTSLRSSFPGAVDVRAHLTTLAFNHICQVIMGKRYQGETDEETQDFMHAINDIFELFSSFPLGDFLPFLKWLDVGNVERRLKVISNSITIYIGKVIAEHEARMKDSGGEAGDFIDVLLKLRDQGGEVLQGSTIKLLLLDMLAAGSDTSSVTLEWALAELIKHPHTMTRLQNEISSVVGDDKLVREEDISRLPYLQAVVKETFRLHPPSPLLLPHYNNTTSCKVMGYEIAKGTTLFLNIYAIGRDPSVWEDPLEFKPERMLHANVDFRGHDFELLPFGAGRRICPGISVAYQLVHLTLANLVHAFDWTMPPGEEVDTITEKFGSTVLMAKKLQAIPSSRLPTGLYN